MAVGFQSFTPGGVLQIDAERKCYVLKATGTAVSDGGRIATITRPLGTAPLLFIHEGDGGFFSSEISGSNRNYYVFTPTASANVRWYEYDVISGDSGAGFGFQLFNSAGQITFDAAQRPLIPYGVVPGVKPGSTQSLAINTGRTYAAHLPTAPFVTTYISTEEFVGDLYRYDIIKPERSGSNLIFPAWDYLLSPGGVPGITFDMNPVTALVIDVHDF
ncbi:MAG: hypothetical protein Q8L84_03390 [Hyphomonas sp.]|nr:hypothetical protein [Hyphomonas sp.]